MFILAEVYKYIYIYIWGSIKLPTSFPFFFFFLEQPRGGWNRRIIVDLLANDQTPAQADRDFLVYTMVKTTTHAGKVSAARN